MHTPQKQPVYYEIDWEKVKSFKDLAIVMTALRFQVGVNYPGIKELEPYIKKSS